MSADLRKYKAKVLAAMNAAQSANKPQVFENSGPEHARIVLEVMLETATQSIDIISGAMHSDVWPKHSIDLFIANNPEGRLRVLLDRAPAGEIPCTSILNEVISEQIEIRWFPEEISRHVCIADRSHVRLEFDKSTREASITFGDPNGAGRKVADAFDRLWAFGVNADGVRPSA